MKYKVNLLLAFFLLVACHDAPWHFQKFQEKGGKIEPVEKVVRITDTVPGIDGKDSIIFRDVPVPCPEPTAPKTRWMVRFDNRRFNDSLKHIRNFYKDSVELRIEELETIIDGKNDSLNIERKINKDNKRSENKANKSSVFWSWLGRQWYWILILGFLIRHFLPIIWNKFFPKPKN